MLKTQIALHFAGGGAYFTGVAVMLLAAVIALHRRTRRQRKSARLLIMLGVVFVLLSSTPAPWPLYACWSIATTLWMSLQWPSNAAMPKLTISASVFLIVVCVAAVAWELPRRRLPRLGPQGRLTVYVIGDSISAGLTRADHTWPKVLAADPAIEVIDLSKAGAIVETAMLQARQVRSGVSVVVLEIGGNDLLGGTSAAEFEKGLRRLLTHLSAPDRRLVMFELPLPPFFHRYGWIQRRLAEEFDVSLIPKRVLAGVFADREATLDGLHLSDAGHRRLAATVGQVFR
ncbi:MAG: hypothetical protein AMXMBFR13_49680 [Phycisphaerae bacterium]